MGVVFGVKFGPNLVQYCKKKKETGISMGFISIVSHSLSHILGNNLASAFLMD